MECIQSIFFDIRGYFETKVFKTSRVDSGPIIHPGVWNSYARLVRLGTFWLRTSRFTVALVREQVNKNKEMPNFYP